MLNVLATKKKKKKEGEREREQERPKETSGSCCVMSIPLIMVMVSWVFAYIQTHHIEQLNVYSSLYFNYTSIKLLKIK